MLSKVIYCVRFYGVLKRLSKLRYSCEKHNLPPRLRLNGWLVRPLEQVFKDDATVSVRYLLEDYEDLMRTKDPIVMEQVLNTSYRNCAVLYNPKGVLEIQVPYIKAVPANEAAILVALDDWRKAVNPDSIRTAQRVLQPSELQKLAAMRPITPQGVMQLAKSKYVAVHAAEIVEIIKSLKDAIGPVHFSANLRDQKLAKQKQFQNMKGDEKKKCEVDSGYRKDNEKSARNTSKHIVPNPSKNSPNNVTSGSHQTTQVSSPSRDSSRSQPSDAYKRGGNKTKNEDDSGFHKDNRKSLPSITKDHNVVLNLPKNSTNKDSSGSLQRTQVSSLSRKTPRPQPSEETFKKGGDRKNNEDDSGTHKDNRKSLPNRNSSQAVSAESFQTTHSHSSSRDSPRPQPSAFKWEKDKKKIEDDSGSHKDSGKSPLNTAKNQNKSLNSPRNGSHPSESLQTIHLLNSWSTDSLRGQPSAFRWEKDKKKIEVDCGSHKGNGKSFTNTTKNQDVLFKRSRNSPHEVSSGSPQTTHVNSSSRDLPRPQRSEPVKRAEDCLENKQRPKRPRMSRWDRDSCEPGKGDTERPESPPSYIILSNKGEAFQVGESDQLATFLEEKRDSGIPFSTNRESNLLANFVGGLSGMKIPPNQNTNPVQHTLQLRSTLLNLNNRHSFSNMDVFNDRATEGWGSDDDFNYDQSWKKYDEDVGNSNRTEDRSFDRQSYKDQDHLKNRDETDLREMLNDRNTFKNMGRSRDHKHFTNRDSANDRDRSIDWASFKDQDPFRNQSQFDGMEESDDEDRLTCRERFAERDCLNDWDRSIDRSSFKDQDPLGNRSQFDETEESDDRDWLKCRERFVKRDSLNDRDRSIDRRRFKDQDTIKNQSQFDGTEESDHRDWLKDSFDDRNRSIDRSFKDKDAFGNESRFDGTEGSDDRDSLKCTERFSKRDSFSDGDRSIDRGGFKDQNLKNRKQFSMRERSGERDSLQCRKRLGNWDDRHSTNQESFSSVNDRQESTEGDRLKNRDVYRGQREFERSTDKDNSGNYEQISNRRSLNNKERFVEKDSKRSKNEFDVKDKSGRRDRLSDKEHYNKSKSINARDEYQDHKNCSDDDSFEIPSYKSRLKKWENPYEDISDLMEESFENSEAFCDIDIERSRGSSNDRRGSKDTENTGNRSRLRRSQCRVRSSDLHGDKITSSTTDRGIIRNKDDGTRGKLNRSDIETKSHMFGDSAVTSNVSQTNANKSDNMSNLGTHSTSSDRAVYNSGCFTNRISVSDMISNTVSWTNSSGMIHNRMNAAGWPNASGTAVDRNSGNLFYGGANTLLPNQIVPNFGQTFFPNLSNQHWASWNNNNPSQDPASVFYQQYNQMFYG